MKRKDFEAARTALVRCRELAERMGSAVTGTEISSLWSEFLANSQRVFSKLDGASKTDGRSQAWFGRIKHERSTDELLTYVHQARHADEHGLEKIVDASSAILSFNPDNYGNPITINEISIKQGKLDKVSYENAYMRLIPGTTTLHPVTNKGKEYLPPTKHLGNAWTDNNAHAVADATLRYMERIISEAEGFIKG